MKAGFKPKKFTKKEWQDNRAPVCQGSGVGKALDAWGKLCGPKLSEMTSQDLSNALRAADNLDKALMVAKKKCDKKIQKETIAGIGEYSKIVNAYKAAALKAVRQNNQKQKFIDSIQTSKNIEKDKALWQLYGKFAKTKGQFFPQYETYNLILKKKLATAVAKYGNKGLADNEYNFYKKYGKRAWNDILYKKFVLGQKEDKDLAERAVSMLTRTVLMDIEQLGNVRSFRDNDPLFAKYVNSKFRIADFR